MVTLIAGNKLWKPTTEPGTQILIILTPSSLPKVDANLNLK